MSDKKDDDTNDTNDTNDTDNTTHDLDLPKDGTMVKATTLPSIEHHIESEEVTGKLHTVTSPFGPPPNCYVDGVAVDPASVEASK